MKHSLIDITLVFIILFACFRWFHRKFGKIDFPPEKKGRMEKEIEQMKAEHPIACRLADLSLIIICVAISLTVIYFLIR
jgi:hypothetical protein